MSMRHKLIGLIVFAVVAANSSAASATEFHIPVVTGKQATSHVFTTNAGTVTCKNIHFERQGSGTTQITLTTTYAGCTAFGFVDVSTDTNGCHYLITGDGVTHIDCPTAAGIKITAPFCTTEIPPQTVGGNTFETNGAGTDIIVVSNLTKITYDECGTVRTNGTYTGKTTLTPPVTFHSAVASTTITASKIENHILTTNGGQFSCQTAHLAKEISATTVNEIVLAINYDKCLWFGFSLSLHENGCTYRLAASGQIHLECPVGKEMELTVPSCTVKIGPQTLNGSTFLNVSSGGVKDIQLTSNNTGITYNECGTVRANGTTAGKFTITGRNHAGLPVDIWRE